jgi:hypothetical protein
MVYLVFIVIHSLAYVLLFIESMGLLPEIKLDE